MANVNTTTERLAEQGLASNSGLRMGFLNSESKAAQNDTITLTDARTVEWCALTIDATGASEPYTLSGNVITLTSVTTGSVSGLVFYK